MAYLETDPNRTIGIQVLAPEYTPGGGWSSVNITQSLMDAYEMANGKTIDDPRQDMTLIIRSRPVIPDYYKRSSFQALNLLV